VRCNAITGGGDRCKLEATHGSYCWSHAPETAEDRSRRARRGGKAGGQGRPGGREIRDLKRRISEVVDAVLDGSKDRGRAAVAIQGLNALRGALELERRIKETEELEERLGALERAAEENDRGGRRWGA
jgi:predicted dehydrogenase